MSTPKKTIYELANRLLQADFLKEREKDILKARLGLEGYQPCTLQEIGDRHGITRERVRQIGVAIVRKVKKFLPEEKVLVRKLFVKAWEPKYLSKERYLIRRRAVIKRKRTIVRNKCKKLASLIEEFSVKKEGKDRINKLFKELRVKYRRNKSLFEPDVVTQMKNLRQYWAQVRRSKPPTGQGQIF